MPMLRRVCCDGSCAGGSRLLNRDCCGHGLRHYQLLSRWTKFLLTWPATYAILAARLLNELLVDLTCGATLLTAQLLNEFLAALLLETEWIRLGWDLEELSGV